MHAADVLRYGHLTLLGTLERVAPEHWEQPQVCGQWSVKNIVAHLTAYEQGLLELLSALTTDKVAPGSSPIDSAANDQEVEQRQHLTPAETLDAYQQAHERVMGLIQELPTAMVRQSGLLTWYGAAY